MPESPCPICGHERRLYAGEEADPAYHCACPPIGPVWLALANSRLGRRELRLRVAWWRYGASMKPGEVPYWIPPDQQHVEGRWGSLPRDAWRGWLQLMWASRDD